MSDTVPSNDEVIRARRIVRAAVAVLPDWFGGETQLMFSITGAELICRLSDTGVQWRGETVAAILTQAEDWVRSTAAETVKTRRDSLDAAMARQRAVEEALGT